MTNLTKRSKKKIPTKLPLRAALLFRFIRWRGPVKSARTGATVVRHRKSIRIGARTAKIAIPVVAVLAVAGGVYRQRQKGSVSPAT
jgi:hypothetical protein